MKNMTIFTVNETDYQIRDSQMYNGISGFSPYANLMNPYEAIQGKTVNSSTGELQNLAAHSVTELIPVDASKRIQMYHTSPYIYCYAADNSYLGYINTHETSGGNAIPASSFATTKFIRAEYETSSEGSVYIMYYDHRTSSKTDWNPIEGNIFNSPMLQQSLVKNHVLFGYFYNKNYLNIDLSDPNSAKYEIKGPHSASYILTNGQYAKNTGIPRNTKYTLSNFNQTYCTIVYEKSTNTFKCIQDYTGDYGDYIVFGFYDHGYVYGNMGMVTINNAVKSLEIETMLSSYDIGDLSELTTAVHENATAIGVNAAAISDEATARSAADRALGARIDNLIAPSGDSVAEIVDARTGYDGTSYFTLAARLNAEAGRVRDVLVVGTDGQYQTIAAAIAAAKDGDIVYIKRGTYEEAIRNRDKPIHIIGESKEEVIWKYPNTNYGTDPYDCGMGSIRNLTIWAYDNGGTPSSEYGRSYCIHIDHQTYYSEHPPVSNYFYCENVRFINDSNECAGLGLRDDMTMEFVNCDFETLSGNEAAFYVHSASATAARCVLKNCTVRNNSSAGQLAALRFEGYWRTNGGCTAVLERNIVLNIGSGPAFVMQKDHHYGDQTVENWQGVSDWLLDPRSQLNNIDEINAR